MVSVGPRAAARAGVRSPFDPEISRSAPDVLRSAESLREMTEPRKRPAGKAAIASSTGMVVRARKDGSLLSVHGCRIRSPLRLAASGQSPGTPGARFQPS